MRKRRNRLELLFLLTLVSPPAGQSQEVRFVQENGITYRVTRRMVEKPTVQVRTRQEQETTYRQEIKTVQQEVNYQTWVPVTGYAYDPKVEGWWNPFQENRVVHRWVPRTQWHLQMRKTTIPITTARWVPETRTVERPIRILRIDTKEQIERVAIGTPPGSGTTLSSNESRRTNRRFGGIARLDGDPPRRGIRAWGDGQSLLR